MRPIILISFIVSICAMMAMPCACEEQLSDEDLRVLDGKVAAINIGRSTITVKYGDLKIEFPVSLDTKLVKDAYDIKLSDFGIGDSVTVEYYRSGVQSRVPMKVVRVTLMYDLSEQGTPEEKKVISYQ